jgi:membrane associated rhomboid family serine protease
MFKSIFEDIKRQFQSGNILTRIIIFNIAVFVVFVLISVFTGFNSSIYNNLQNWFSLSSNAWEILTRPWTILSHMFMHAGFGHIFWNMLLLYWFGRIVGDFIGDKKILPLYILGALVGAIFYYLSYNYFGYGTPGVTGYALGASAAVMAFVAASAYLSPDYEFNLIIIGPVKLKFIAATLLLLDLVAIGKDINTGGHIAHLGGFCYGALYVYMLRSGTDLGEPLYDGYEKVKSFFNKNTPTKKKEKSPVFVRYKAPESAAKRKRKAKNDSTSLTHEEQLDKILEKIKVSGYESLNAEEKEFLIQASKKD